MISVITYGRNDNYGYNLYKRTACAFNCLAEALTEDDEILFVDYNTPDHLPTLPEFIWDTLTEKALNVLKVIRISAHLHRALKGDSPLSILENVSRNAAIVRSNPANRWILSTNPDVVLVLSQRWANLPHLLDNRPPSFYEMPRFDIPESVWSALRRMQPRENMRTLRDWLIAHGAAIAETVPDHRFQKFLLFDAPGDFQLAPRDYFFRLRGFDESMNKYLHSDSNLAKRMWLINGGKTDHLLGDLWVIHQDHYLSGEWASNARTITHNDYISKVLHQLKPEANDEDWGLRNLDLPMFALAKRHKNNRAPDSQTAAAQAELPLSQEVNWETHPYYRLCHYQPKVLALYLSEILQVLSPQSRLAYLGDYPETLENICRVWERLHPHSAPVLKLSDASGKLAPDVLLVDFYHERSQPLETRIRVLRESLQRRKQKGTITDEGLEEELAIEASRLDEQEQTNRLLPLWSKCFPLRQPRAEMYVILMGCNTAVNIFEKFQDFFSQACASAGLKRHSHTPWRRLRRAIGNRISRNNHQYLPYFHHTTPETQRLMEPLQLRYLYMHHRLIVMTADIPLTT